MSVSTLDALLDRLMEPIEKLLVIADGDPSLALLQKAPKRKVHGRGLTAYRGLKLTPGGSFARGSEGGTLPAGTGSTSIEGSYAVKKLLMSMDFNDEEIVAMEGGRDAMHTTMEEELGDAFSTFKARQGAMFFQRGDGIVARANGAVSADTTITCDSPICAVEGDTLLGYTNRGTSVAGSLSSAATVTFVDHENLKIKIASAASVADEEVLSYSGGVVDQSSTICQWPIGMTGHLDNVDVGTSNWWDSGDGATWDHLDTYLGQARSSYAKLNCQYMNASSAVVNEYWLSIPAALATAQGSKPADVVYIMNPKMFRRVVKYFSGKLQLINEADIVLPGGKMRLPAILGVGQRQIPVIQSYYMKDGVICAVNIKDFEQLTSPGHWVTQGGSRMLLVPYSDGSTTQTYSHKYRFTYVMYWNTACFKPFRQAVLYGLDTTDD